MHIECAPAAYGEPDLRRIISMALGAAMAAGGGLSVAYMMLSVHEPIKGIIWIIPITVMSIGVAILYDDLHGAGKR